MIKKSIVSSSWLMVAIGATVLLPQVAQAQHAATQQDRQQARAARRQAIENMTPEQRQQYFTQRFNALPADVKARILAQRQAMQQLQQEEEAQQAQNKSLMNESGITDEPTQNAMLDYLRGEDMAKLSLLAMAQETAGGIKNQAVTETDLAKQLTDFRTAVAQDRIRHDESLLILDQSVHYTTRPRIEAFLTMMGAISPEASRIGSPAVLFADAKPAAAQTTTADTDAAKSRAEQERTFMNALGLSDKDTQDAVIAFVQKENDARLPLLGVAQKLTGMIKAGAATGVQAADAGAADKATVTLVDDTPAAGGTLTITDQAIAAELAEFHKEAAADWTRYTADLKDLDKQVSYSTKPRLDAFLTMVELVGDEAAYVGGPAKIFGSPVPRFGRGRQQFGGNTQLPDGLPDPAVPTPIVANAGEDGLPGQMDNPPANGAAPAGNG